MEGRDPQALLKSAWTKLLSPFKALLRGKGCLSVQEELPEGEEGYKTHPVWETAARGLDFTTVWKKRARKPRHINIGELRAYLKAEHVAGTMSHDCRAAIGGDSQVTAGAICKGRGASPSLNRELRKSLPEVLGFGIYSSPGYINIAHNPADDPTRGKPVRESDIQLPEWWLSAQAGDFAELDNFLESIQLHPTELAGYASLSELYPSQLELLDETTKPKCTQMHARARAKLKARHDAKSLEDPKHSFSKHDKESSDIPRNCNSLETPWNLCIQAELESFGEDVFISGEGHSWPPTIPGFLDLFSGRKGFAKAACRLGAPWTLTIDIEDGPQCDLLDPSVRRKLERLIEAGCFLQVSAAPNCCSFSRAITPAIRSRDELLGIQPLRTAMAERINQGNSHAKWLASIVRICLQLHIFYFIENPDSSFLWLHPAFVYLPFSANKKYFKLDFCRFSTSWRRRTRFLTCGRLNGARRLCLRNHRHQVLRGRAKGKKACWTKIAEPCPRKLCSLLAWAACLDTGVYSYKSS